MSYLLDTSTVSFAIRGVGQVGKLLLERSPADVRVSSITAAELHYGVAKRASTKLARLVGAFLSAVEIEPFDAGAAALFGPLRHSLETRGRPIGLADTLIAAHAMALGLVLVTDNVDHFRRVRGLTVENWK